jgi:hypothetical protein
VTALRCDTAGAGRLRSQPAEPRVRRGAEAVAIPIDTAVARIAGASPAAVGNNRARTIPMTSVGLPYMTDAATTAAATGASVRNATLAPAARWNLRSVRPMRGLITLRS